MRTSIKRAQRRGKKTQMNDSKVEYQSATKMNPISKRRSGAGANPRRSVKK